MTSLAPIPLRTLGKTTFPLSEIGFGAWAIGGSWGTDVPEETAVAALNAALDGGTNFIDTANVYGGGRSERLIGEVLTTRSERVYVATKIGREGGFVPEYGYMEGVVRGSLERLGVESLDLLQLHCVPAEVLRGPVWEHLEKLKANGLIRHYGASVESIEEGLHCLTQTGCASLQVIFNIFRQRLIEGLFPAAQAANVGLIARVPLASGILTGKFHAGHHFESSDHRNFNADGQAFNVGETFAGVPFERGVEFTAKVGEIIAPTGLPLPVAALRWILDFPAITTVIPGAKNPEQARQNLVAAAVPPLPDSVHAELKSFYESEVDSAVRGPY